MKRLLIVAVLAVAISALLVGAAFAAGPVNPTAQGYGPGAGVAATGVCPMGNTPGTMRGGMMGRGAAWAGQPDAVAELLGLTAEEIQAERQAGKSLVEIAASKGVSEDTLVDTILSAKKEILAGLVADGKLTQEQMDLMVEHMTTQIKVMVERTDVGRAQGGMMQGRRGGMRGGMMRGGNY